MQATITGGSDDYHGRYIIRAAQYAKGKVAITCPGWHQMKTRAARICCAKGMGARYTGRENAYIMSPAAAKRFLKYYAGGYDANVITRELQPPSGTDQ